MAGNDESAFQSDQWIYDLTNAVPGVVFSLPGLTGDGRPCVYYNNPACYSNGVTTNSLAARQLLYQQGWSTNQWCQ